MRRYPGLTPFTSHQKDVFFGRKHDIDELSELIFVERKVLLYSKSGYGKTSLLNAGVVPRLSENKNFEFVRIRFRSYTEKSSTPNQTFLQALKQHIDFNYLDNSKTIIDKYIKEHEENYWTVFKKNQLLGNKHKTYILIFDQFEELFTYPEKQINEFRKHFAEIILENNYPQFFDDIEDTVFADKENIPKNDIDLLYSNINIKAVLAMRSDRLSELNALAEKIIDIQKVFYELKPLNTEQAEQAIIEPAKLVSNFESRPFDFNIAAVNKIISALSENNKQSIETTQLQIVCQKLEEDIILKKKANVLITEKDIPNFKDIFRDFYHDTTNKLNKEVQIIARKFIEDQLIVDNRRISLDELVCQKHLETEILNKLVNIRLLRVEPNTTGGFSYELSHDTLVPAINEIAKKRRDEEEKEFLRLKQRKQLRIIVLAILISVVSIGAAIFGFWQKNIAQNNQKKAEDALVLADEMQLKSETAIFDKAVKEKFPEWKGYDNYQWSLVDFEETKEGIEILSKIDTLDFRNNALVRIPKKIIYCPNIKLINLLENPDINWKQEFSIFDKLNPDANFFVCLDSLYEIPEIHWERISGLKILKTGFSEIPSIILSLTQLEYLDISAEMRQDNNLIELPKELFDLTNLKELYLSSCNISNIPVDIKKLYNLEKLDLSNNNLESIPSEIGFLQNLLFLNLGSDSWSPTKNKLTKLPDEIEKLQKLNTLILDNNKFSKILINFGELNNLMILSLINNNLSSLPSEIGELKKLSVLNLEHNYIEHVPIEISGLINLKELYLGDNKLIELPKEIGNLKNLEIIDLSENRLLKLPDEIGELTNLFLFNIRYNQLVIFPNTIGNLKKLLIIKARTNKLIELPKEIGELENLTILELSENEISYLPNEIGNLQNLLELNLGFNNLDSLPKEIIKLQNLKKLSLWNNQISNEELYRIKGTLNNTDINFN